VTGEAEWLRLDAPFMENDLHGPADGPSWSIEAGQGPVLFTAVHAVVHHRPGMATKSAEARTGGLARALAATLGAGVGVVLRSAEEADANFDPDHPFKRALAASGLVGSQAVVIDLHGMTNDHPFDVAIGRGPDPGSSALLADAAVGAFMERGFVVDPDGRECGLTGSGLGTVTAFAQRHGGQAVQVEIARRNRTFLSGEDRRLRLLQAFADLAGRVELLLHPAA
jgi:hypothetical protein